MNDIVNKDNLFCDEYRALILLVAMCCIKTIDPAFYKSVDKLERIITRYIKEYE